MIKELTIFIFILGLVAFNWPILTIFSGSLPLYLFLTWAGFILFHVVSDIRSADGD